MRTTNKCGPKKQLKGASYAANTHKTGTRHRAKQTDIKIKSNPRQTHLLAYHVTPC